MNLKQSTMKTNVIFLLAFSFCIVSTGCKQQQQPAIEEQPAAVEVDLINDEFTEAQQEIEQTMSDIMQSIKDGDIDKLLSFHAYGPKFTEFINGAPRHGSKGNEEIERSTFEAVTEVIKMDANDMKIAVYGDVANVTFHSDFQLKFGEDLAVVNNQISLLFVKNREGAWKIVHEHHSPLRIGEE
jgi:ketosteroid isomerase-like protein